MVKVKYNKENKNSITNNLNNCQNILNEINNRLYNMPNPYDYYYRNTLNNIKNTLRINKNDLLDYKNSLNNCIENINKDELELSAKINNIEELIIQKF